MIKLNSKLYNNNNNKLKIKLCTIKKYLKVIKIQMIML